MIIYPDNATYQGYRVWATVTRQAGEPKPGTSGAMQRFVVGALADGRLFFGPTGTALLTWNDVKAGIESMQEGDTITVALSAS